MNTIKLLFPIIGLTLSLSVQAQVSVFEKAEKQFELNNFQGAIKSYRKAIESAPDKSVVYSRLGDVYVKLGKNREAIEWYDKASGAGNEAAQLKLGWAYISVGKYDQAAELAIKVTGNKAEAQRILETCHFASIVQGPSMYEVSNAAALNSSADDYFPSFTGSQAIVFLSSRTDMPRRHSRMPAGSNQLLRSTYSSGGFSKPECFNSDLKNIYGEGPICQAGLQAVITQNNFVSGIRPMELQGLELSLKKATVNSEGQWKTAQSLVVGGAGYSNAFASISADASRLVFASNREGGKGGFDLYMCKLVGEQWGEPVNLSEINTPGNEITPFFSGEHLFFSSDYHRGLGGYDIFRVTQNNGVYSEIIHLGDQVNSCADDYGFVLDEPRGLGLFSSNREGGKGGEDLYFARSIATTVNLTVVDEDSRPLANVKVDLSKCRNVNLYSDKDGKCTFQLGGEFNCEAELSKTGFIATKEPFRGNKGVEPLFPVITLKRAPVPYFGFVFDEDGLPVEGVQVKATSTNAQLKFEAISDATGKYTLPLEAENDYLLYFSKSRFINLNINKKSLSKEDLSLGSVRLRMAFEGNVPTHQKAGKGENSSEPRFTLQIASISDKNADLSAYKKALKEVGEVYITPGSNGTYKIKVGKFATREEAVGAFQKAEKAGYKPMISTALGGTKQGERQPPIELLKPDENVYSNYALRLCALSKPENFNGSKIDRLGKLSSMKSGEMTVFFLSNFQDLAAAKNALSEVQKNGFHDAYIVEKKEGKFIKIKS